MTKAMEALLPARAIALLVTGSAGAGAEPTFQTLLREGGIAPGRSAFVSGRAVDVNISRLRRKIEADPANPVDIKTVHGAGHVFSNSA